MKRLLLLLHALLALTLVPAVEAQPESAYYGVSIGEFAYSDVAFGQTFNDSVDSWRLMLGYLLLEHFALEGSYGETSTVRDTASGSLPGSPELGIETEITNFLTFRVLGTLPFDNGLSLMAGFGFFVSSRTSSSASTAFRTSAARSGTTGAGPRTRGRVIRLGPRCIASRLREVRFRRRGQCRRSRAELFLQAVARRSTPYSAPARRIERAVMPSAERPLSRLGSNER